MRDIPFVVHRVAKLKKEGRLRMVTMWWALRWTVREVKVFVQTIWDAVRRLEREGLCVRIEVRRVTWDGPIGQDEVVEGKGEEREVVELDVLERLRVMGLSGRYGVFCVSRPRFSGTCCTGKDGREGVMGWRAGSDCVSCFLFSFLSIFFGFFASCGNEPSKGLLFNQKTGLLLSFTILFLFLRLRLHPSLPLQGTNFTSTALSCTIHMYLPIDPCPLGGNNSNFCRRAITDHSFTPLPLESTRT